MLLEKEVDFKYCGLALEGLGLWNEEVLMHSFRMLLDKLSSS